MVFTGNPPTQNFSLFFKQRSNGDCSVTNGVVGTAGVDLGFGHLRVSPELRYVHWSAPFLHAFEGDGSFRFSSNQDEVFVLLDVSWH